MKIAVIGAGAVGRYDGFKLARGGHHVVLIGRPQHVEAIERQGLRLEMQTLDEHFVAGRPRGRKPCADELQLQEQRQ